MVVVVVNGVVVPIGIKIHEQVFGQLLYVKLDVQSLKVKVKLLQVGLS